MAKIKKVKDFDFRWKFGDFEVRTNRTNYLKKNYSFDISSDIRTQCPIELVKWEENDGRKHCFVIAYFYLCKDDGYELRFCGNRPFEYISVEDISEIWKQLGAAQKMLDEYFKAMED